jgi:hypothetical protein
MLHHYAGIPPLSNSYMTRTCTRPTRPYVPGHFLCDPDAHISSRHHCIVMHPLGPPRTLVGPLIYLPQLLTHIIHPMSHCSKSTGVYFVSFTHY